MTHRRNYEMSEEDLKLLLHASKPTPVPILSGGILMSGTPQEKANNAWRRLGVKMGFRYLTVQPIPGKPRRHFSSEPTQSKKAAIAASNPSGV